MNSSRIRFTALSICGALLCGLLAASEATPVPYTKVIQDTAAMVGNAQAQTLAQKFGLQIMNVTWEDTGRYKNSSVGPNISDMTIQVEHQQKGQSGAQLTCMPVIRFPNFADKTADLPLEKFFVLVGNEKGDQLHPITVKELLGNLRRYLHTPASWKGKKTSLLAERDTHALVSAQACFLPVPKGDKATFNPVLFNYQSYKGDPAVLTILATREGTSITVIDNVRDGFSAGQTWGQRLFFNQKGERASLTGQRISDFINEKTEQGEGSSDPTPEAAGESGLNLVLMIQVPLKQKKPMRRMMMPTACMDMVCKSVRKERSDVEAAVIGHGKVEGPYTEIDNLEIERDPRFPVRVTVQFYKATSNGVVSADDMQDIHNQIGRVYKEADFTGSLVVAGNTNRPTEYEGCKNQPADWWQTFWHRHETNTGQNRVQAMRMLQKLLGPEWDRLPPAQVEKALAALKK